MDFFTGVFILFVGFTGLSQGDPGLRAPRSCTIIGCSSFLFYHDKEGTIARVQDVALLFKVGTGSVTRGKTGYFVDVSCSCTTPGLLFASSTYKVTSNDLSGGREGISRTVFDNMAFLNTTSTSPIYEGQLLQIDLLCGCSYLLQGWKSAMTYTVKSGDDLTSIAHRFQSTLEAIVLFNNISNPDQIQADEQVIYVPMSDSPSELGGVKPAAKPKRRRISMELLAAIIAAGVAASVAAVVLAYYLYKTGKLMFAKEDIENKTISQRTSSLPLEATSLLEVDRPYMFTFYEIEAATANFSDEKKLGEGAFGSVYSGVLRGRNVAIKQMKASKSDEFLAELKVLCKVHHSNLVELTGYASGPDSLFLVYEHVTNGALSDHLHSPIAKGHEILPWTTRVQIALDAARGLEYIHEHTRVAYVHRDVKTSNILLDGSLRAKVADFGLAKLVLVDGEGLTTRVVGTFGYLAPEYVRDGHATAKSDVYAFGVVLMELITGLEALLRNKDKGTKKYSSGERRSLASFVLSRMQGNEPTPEFISIIDNNMQSYHLECVFEMAMLSKSCTLEDCSARPSMKHIVHTLSRILSLSMEWEATVAGTSQIFSGLATGR